MTMFLHKNLGTLPLQWNVVQQIQGHKALSATGSLAMTQGTTPMSKRSDVRMTVGRFGLDRQTTLALTQSHNWHGQSDIKNNKAPSSRDTIIAVKCWVVKHIQVYEESSFFCRESGHDSGNDSQEEEGEEMAAASPEVTAASPQQQPSKRPRQELSQQEAVLLQPPVAAASKPKIQAGFRKSFRIRIIEFQYL